MIILKSPFEYLLKSSSSEIEVSPTDSILVEDEDFAQIYPQQNGLIPFRIDFQNLKENNFYSLGKKDEKTFVIFKTPKKLRIFRKERLNFSGKICDIQTEENLLSFETNDRKIEYFCENSLKNAKFFKIKDFACVQSEQEFFAFSMKTQKLCRFSGEVERNGDTLSVVKDFKDSESRIRKTEYKFSEDIVMQNQEFVKTASPHPRDLAPYKLLESVKAKDFSRAIDFLSQDLKNQVNNEKIGEFFGNFSTFLPISATEFLILSDEVNSFAQFSLDGDKIADISVDALC